MNTMNTMDKCLCNKTDSKPASLSDIDQVMNNISKELNELESLTNDITCSVDKLGYPESNHTEGQGKEPMPLNTKLVDRLIVVLDVIRSINKDQYYIKNLLNKVV